MNRSKNQFESYMDNEMLRNHHDDEYQYEQWKKTQITKTLYYEYGQQK